MNRNNIQSNKLSAIFLMGPTASGKTSLAIDLKKKNLEKIDIISVDSAAVYRGMDIGTSKPILSELKVAPHKLIDIRDPSECYSVADFFYDANKEIHLIRKSGRIPLLVGGTMLYFKVLLQGLFFLPSSNKRIRDCLQCEARQKGWFSIYKKLRYIDPIAASLIHINDHNRIIRALEIFFISGKTWTDLKRESYNNLSGKILQFGIIPKKREILYNRIEQRFYKMLEMGLENEVRLLLNKFDIQEKKMSFMSCIGYRQMWGYISGKIDYSQMVFQGMHATRRLAKRQLTWLRHWSNNMHWLNSDDSLSIISEKMMKVLGDDLS